MATATANRFSPAASKRGERRRGLHAAGVEAVERLGATCALLLCLLVVCMVACRGVWHDDQVP
jgi:hypothetical protein